MAEPSCILVEHLFEEVAPCGHRCCKKGLALLSLVSGLSLVVVVPSVRSGGRQHLVVQDPAISAVSHYLQPARTQRFTHSATAPLSMHTVMALQSREPARNLHTHPLIVLQPRLPARNPHFIGSFAAVATDDVAVETMPASSMDKKKAVLEALDSGMDAAVREKLTMSLPALEASNPTPNPAFSGKLTGTWLVKYTGSVAMGPVDSPTREIALLMYAAGFGPGAAALSLAKRLPDDLVQVKTVSLEISQLPGESRATLALRLLNGQSDADVELLCDVTADGPTKLIETSKEVMINRGTPTSIPEQVRYTRDLFVTYLDDELLIVRDATGSVDILLRESPGFTSEAQPVDEGAATSSDSVGAQIMDDEAVDPLTDESSVS